LNGLLKQNQGKYKLLRHSIETCSKTIAIAGVLKDFKALAVRHHFVAPVVTMEPPARHPTFASVERGMTDRHAFHLFASHLAGNVT